MVGREDAQWAWGGNGDSMQHMGMAFRSLALLIELNMVIRHLLQHNYDASQGTCVAMHRVGRR